VLEASRLNGVGVVVLAGSDHIYGDAEYLPIDEKHPHKPKDSYSVSKVFSMDLCKLYREEYGLDTRVLVSGNVFGEFQDGSKVIPIFIGRALKGLPITLFGGNQTRAFYYISNLIDAYVLVAEKAESGIYNVDGYTEVSLKRLAKDIIARTGSGSELLVEPYRYDEHSDFRLVLDKTKIEGLGYKEIVSYAEGLERTIRWYQNGL
jgi:nucleoside-diphosphate-sugar epimerase